MSVSCECCVLLGRGLCDELITWPEESYRLWCVVLCDLGTSWMRRPWSALGHKKERKRNPCMPRDVRRRFVAAHLESVGSESRQGHGRPSHVSVVCCQVEVSATSWSLGQKSPTDCGASFCVIWEPHERGGHETHWVTRKKERKKKENLGFFKNGLISL